jgi:hypothetical protein
MASEELALSILESHLDDDGDVVAEIDEQIRSAELMYSMLRTNGEPLGASKVATLLTAARNMRAAYIDYQRAYAAVQAHVEAVVS